LDNELQLGEMAEIKAQKLNQRTIPEFSSEPVYQSTVVRSPLFLEYLLSY